MDAKDAVAILGSPVAVVGALWSFYSNVLTARKMLNDTRDLILGLGKEKPRARVRLCLLRNDWIPTWVGFSACLALHGAVIAGLSSPPLLLKLNNALAEVPWTVALITPAIGLSVFIGTVVATFASLRLGGRERSFMWQEIRLIARQERRPEEGASNPAENILLLMAGGDWLQR